jgi:hypothetical protein
MYKAMIDFISKIDSKTLTTGGCVLVALALIYVLWDVAGNKITSLADAQTKNQTQLIDVLLKNAQVIEGNTKVMEQVLRTR